jgi:hypothetical protein
LASSMKEELTFNSRLQECPIAIVGMASIFADAKKFGRLLGKYF